jgi:ubiquinone/menaquinone biosynthesis C-methylase UbiE
MMRIKKYQNIELAKKLYLNGTNVTAHFHNSESEMKNSPEVIEIVYDLQAGSYIKTVKENLVYSNSYAVEMAEIINLYMKENDNLLDVGTGELTALSLLIPKLKYSLSRILAFDISWSRLKKGLSYASTEMGQSFEKLEVFVADMFEIPFVSNSIDILISSHALEPNGGREKEILSELFRVTKNYCILFEPCYEDNSPEGQKRMDRLGYIKNLEKYVRELDGELVDKITLKNIANPLNPTTCYVIAPNKNRMNSDERRFGYSVPGTDLELSMVKNVMFSPALGISFPLIDTIPILKNEYSIITSAMDEMVEKKEISKC